MGDRPGGGPGGGRFDVRLRRVDAADVGRERQPAVPPEIIAPVLEIIEAVREGARRHCANSRSGGTVWKPAGRF